MDLLEARVLLNNLLNRVELSENGRRQLPGTITDEELNALRLALSMLDKSAALLHKSPDMQQPSVNVRVEESSKEITESVEQVPERSSTYRLDLAALRPPPVSTNVRICLDFGTAMSKATLIEESVIGEDEDDTFENITVLKLGIPGEQEEISETMLISSIYIDNNGLLWFGKAAERRSALEGEDGTRRRLDNVKRSLSEGALDEPVPKAFNPTENTVTYGDMVLGYLVYLTWTVNEQVEEIGYSRYLPRRFAMPCLTDREAAEANRQMEIFLGEAQVLADSFGGRVNSGLSLNEFITAVAALRSEERDYRFVGEAVTEPLGVANSMLSWRNSVDNLVMVVDVGAGTSDFSLFRIRVDPEKNINSSKEVEGSARGITEAGNYLDQVLIELLLRKAGLTVESSDHIRVRSSLEQRIRDYKETLFNEKELTVYLVNEVEVEVELEEFLELDAVQRFGGSLRETMQGILQDSASSWVRWIQMDPRRRLVVATTGGGSTLPMVKELVNGPITIDGTEVPIGAAEPFPKWLGEIDPNLEIDYSRISVSLGGARRNLINRTGSARITADVHGTATLQGYYQKGN